MKKFYFLLVAMMVSIAASAVDYYLTGANLGWDPGQGAYKFTANGDGTYTFKLNKNLDTSGDGFKITAGNWTDKANLFGADGGTLVPGESYKLGTGDSYGNIKTNPEVLKNPTFVLNPSAKTLVVTAEEGEIIEDTKYYAVHGSIIKAGWASVLLEDNDGDGWYEYTGTLLEGEFGIKMLSSTDDIQSNKYQIGWIGGGANITEANKEYSMAGSGNSKSTLAGEYTIKYNPTTKMISFNGDNGQGGGDEPVTPPTTNYSGWYLNVQGAYNNYEPKGVKFNADGTATAENQAIGTGEFELKIWNGSNDLFYSTGGEIEAGKSYTVADASGAKMTIKGATAGQEFNVFFDHVNSTMTVTAVGGGDEPVNPPTPENPTLNYKLYGNIVTGSANDWSGVEFEYADGVYTIAAVKLYPGNFGLEVYDANWNRNSNPNWIGGGATIAETDKAYKLDGSGNSTFSLDEGNYTVTYNATDNEITFAPYGGTVEETYSYKIKGSIFDADATDWTWSPVLTPVVGSDVEFEINLSNLIPGSFGIAKVDQNGTQKAWYQSVDGKGAVSGNGVFDLTDFGGENFVSTIEGSAKFILNVDDMTLTITGTTGVEVIDLNEGAEAEYFNLQGVRVAEPANGLYIVRRGNTVTKEIVR